MSAASRPATVALICLLALACAWAVAPAPAWAIGANSPLCRAAKAVSAVPGLSCGALGNAGRVLKESKQLVTGNIGGAVGTAVGGATQTITSTVTDALGFAAIGGIVLGAAHVVLNFTAAALSATTSPQLRSTWFSSTYWRMAAVAAILTLPFLFAAAVQALIRSDLALLARATFGYLPLGILGVAIAAPLTMLLLAATDQLCGFISAAAGNESAHFLASAGAVIGSLSLADESPFLAFLVGLFMIGAAFLLWIELLMREAAVYVIVLMLPLAFAAMVWPARRIWAVRAVELLVALILSKFAIVAVLSLGGAAISASAGDHSVTGAMAGAVLIMLAAFSPWALVRLVPMAELANGAAGALRGEVARAGAVATDAGVTAAEWSQIATAAMRRDAQTGGADAGPRAPFDPSPSGGGDPAAAGDGPAPDGGGGGAGPDGGGGGAGPDGGGDSAGDDPLPDPVFDWARMPTLELGPNGTDGSTGVWPHEDAS
jgi:hypothetical protein